MCERNLDGHYFLDWFSTSGLFKMQIF